MVEVKRVLQNKLFVITLTGLILMMILFSLTLNFDGETQAYYRDYDQFQTSQKIENVRHPYLKNQLKYQSTLYDELNSEIENYENKLASSLFSDVKNKKIIEKEILRLQEINKHDIDRSPNIITHRILKTNIYNLAVIIFSFILVYILFSQDIEARILNLFSSTSDALSNVFKRKVIVLIIYQLLFIVIIGFIIFYSLTIRNNSITSPIHSMSRFANYPYVISIYAYIIIQLLNAFLLGFVTSIILIFFLSVTRNFLLSSSIFFLFVLFEYLVFSFVSINSSYSIFKYINYVSLYKNSIQSQTVVVMGRPINALTLNSILIMIFSTLLLISSFYTYQTSNKTINHKHLFTMNYNGSSLLLQQGMQILFVFKGIIILLLMISYGTYKYFDYKVTVPDWKQELTPIQKEYLGPIQNETLTSLEFLIEQSKIARFKETKCLDERCTQDEINKYTNEAKKLWVYEYILEEIEETIQNGGNYYLNKDGFSQIYEEEYYFSMRLNFIIISIASLFIIFVHQHGIKNRNLLYLIRSTKSGYHKVQIINLINYLLIALAIFLFVNGMYIAKLLRYYDLFSVNFEMRNIVSTTMKIKNLSYWMISILVQLLIYSLIINIVYYSQEKLGNKKSILIGILTISTILITSIIMFDFSLLMLFTPQILINIKKSIIYIIVVVLLNILFVSKNIKMEEFNE